MPAAHRVGSPVEISIMHSSFALDLKTVRHRSGLSQEDCGHLLGVDKRRISALERGNDMPTIPEICCLSLIFGRSFESLFGSVFRTLRIDLAHRLATLPGRRRKGWIERFNRQRVLNDIATRLEDDRPFYG